MSNYVIKGLTEQEADAADELLQSNFDQEERDRQSDKLESRIAKFRPHIGLKTLRKGLGLTQAQPANVAGVTRRTIQSYESGEKQIPSGVVIRLAALYHFDLHRFFTGEAHVDNLEVRTKTAEVVANVIIHLMSRPELLGMAQGEMQRIAMEFARSHPNASDVTKGNIFDSIRIVTGGKYLREEISYSELDD